ncbi:MAG: hypothetical protein IPM55_23955 [Acidobacteria bacterium]|nr:hypothetical protein [Acidobacteriota bacterium]
MFYWTTRWLAPPSSLSDNQIGLVNESLRIIDRQSIASKVVRWNSTRTTVHMRRYRIAGVGQQYEIDTVSSLDQVWPSNRRGRRRRDELWFCFRDHRLGFKLPVQVLKTQSMAPESEAAFNSDSFRDCQ